MARTGLVTLSMTALFYMVVHPLFAQQCIRSMEQDSSLNNLIDPPGYQTAPMGTLGTVTRVGSGSKSMILIPGLGFSGDIFQEFMEPLQNEYTMFAVTLPGFGGTQAPPSPALTVSFGEQTWTNGAFSAIERLIESEGMERPVVVGHWLLGPQLALRLAMKYPDKVSAVIILAGSACFVPTDTTKYPAHPPLDKRVSYIDQRLAPNWFKTVTRETWDDNNFLPGDYAVNPIRGLRLWREAAQPPLHVWTRYLCEFYSQDISLELKHLAVPTLLIKPGLEGNYCDPGQDYMTAYCHTCWDASAPKNRYIEMVMIPNARACLWFDQPEKLRVEIERFLSARAN